MEKTESKNINPKFVDMVSRFQAIPKDRKHSVERLKLMLFKFEPWYRRHREQLTKDEREYLQANICRVDKKDDEIEETPKDPWEE